MAQTGYTPISIYYSATATNTPTAGNLVAGELAINTADGKLFYKDSSGVVQTIASKNGVAGGSNTQVQYNSSGSLAGSANMTFSGTALTLANDASISGLTVGKGANSLATNTIFGSGLGAVTTGNINSAFGYSNLNLNTSGVGNSAFGVTCLSNNTTGTYNSAFGYEALNQNTTASHNSAFGYETLKANTTGASNVGFGNYALFNNTTASNNTAVGYQAAYSTTNANVTAIGYQALYSNTTSRNTAVGSQAGYAVTTGDSSTFIGQQAGNNLTTGYAGIYLGATSQASAVGAQYETVIGTGLTAKGNSTTFIGNQGGGACYQGNNSATWSITSDARLKKNIVDNTTGLNAISQIQVRNFEYRIADEITDLPKEQAIGIAGVQLGAIAQEIQAILPDCVKTESTGVMSVDTTNLTWYLINAVKELNAKITALENK